MPDRRQVLIVRVRDITGDSCFADVEFSRSP
jgi:hypothetical protein